MFESTQELSEARLWADDFLAGKNAAKYYLSDANFVTAYKQEDGFSFIVKGEPFYAQLYGANAYLDPRCNEVAVESSSRFGDESFAARGGGFEFWEVETMNSHAPIELLTDHDEINSLIENHAPDSSTRPGDHEEVFWGGIRNPQGDLVACAVVVKWQSGFHIVASVTTRTSERGQGIGTALIIGIASRARELEIPRLGLGMRRGNTPAQRIYEKAGYKRIGTFTNYSRG